VPVGEYRCQDVATAKAAIIAAGLVVGTIDPAPPISDDTWIVLDQDPQPGQQVPPGSPVNLTVYQPTVPCVVPSPSPSPSPTP
jgi:beta-lactam-binding protein with PASTA domain